MNKEILKFALPNIISNLSVPLLSTVDTALMGYQDSEIYIGAIALGALIFNFVYWSFAFLRMGTTGLTAQALGKNEHSTIINVLGRALFTALVGSSLVILLQIPLSNLSFGLLQASEEVETLAIEYFSIRIWAAPATLAIYAMMGWFFGMQNAWYPLLLTLVVNVVNIVANLYFVNHLGMKADGVAWGTVIAQYTGLLTALLLFRYKYAYLLKHLQRKVIFEWHSFVAFLSLNRDIFIRTFCLIFALAFFDNEAAKQGDIILAVNSVLLQFVTWMSYGIDGFAHASESLVGKYLGAKNNSKLRQAIRLSFLWGMGFAVVYALIYGIFGTSLLSIFTNQSVLIEQANQYLIWIILFPIVATPGYIYDGIYVGYTASAAMRNTMLVSLILYLLVYYTQLHFFNFGNHGLWAALLFFMLMRGVTQAIAAKKVIRQVC